MSTRSQICWEAWLRGQKHKTSRSRAIVKGESFRVCQIFPLQPIRDRIPADHPNEECEVTAMAKCTGYLGDGYPLCMDQPAQGFLRIPVSICLQIFAVRSPLAPHFGSAGFQSF